MAELFGFLKRKTDEATVPEGTRVYVIGDIHGRADLLNDLHEKIRADAADFPDWRKVLVYIGDYVDRGLQSKEVIDLVLNTSFPDFEPVYLKGNHEALMLDFLGECRDCATWLGNGGKATLYSYGVHLDERLSADARLEEARRRLNEALPPAHRAFLESLRLSHEEGDYLFVHAGIRPRLPLDRQDEHSLLWIRDEFLCSSADHGKVVVHGHSVSWNPEVRQNRIGIDTGAFASGVLTCLVLSGSSRTFLQTQGSARRGSTNV